MRVLYGIGIAILLLLLLLLFLKRRAQRRADEKYLADNFDLMGCTMKGCTPNQAFRARDPRHIAVDREFLASRNINLDFNDTMVNASSDANCGRLCLSGHYGKCDSYVWNKDNNSCVILGRTYSTGTVVPNIVWRKPKST